MKKIFFYTLLFFGTAIIGIVSCKKATEFKRITSSFITIEELRAMYQNKPLILKSTDDANELFISGIVISNVAGGNTPDSTLIIQNYANGRLRGISLSMEGNLKRYAQGDSVVVRVEGKTLERVKGVLKVSGLGVRDVGRISASNEQKLNIETESFEPVLGNKDVYESTLVKLTKVKVLGVERNQNFGDRELKLSDGQREVSVQTRDKATFAAALVPISGDFIGIISYTLSNEAFLSIRGTDDYKGKFMAPESYFGFPEGFEQITSGTRKGGTIQTSGYENYTSGTWYSFRALSRGSEEFINRRGTWTIMTNNTLESAVSMEFDLSHGASKFSFYYGAATKATVDRGDMWAYVEYSQNKGQTWTALGGKLVVTGNPNRPQYFKEYTGLDIKGCVRFRIRTEPTVSGGRLSIDDIDVKPNPNSDSCE